MKLFIKNNPTKHCGLVFWLDINPTTLIEIAVYKKINDDDDTLLCYKNFTTTCNLYSPFFKQTGLHFLWSNPFDQSFQ